jgi:AP2 domain
MSTKGVSFYKRTGKWRAYIRIDGKLKHLGYFNTEEEAGATCRKAKAQKVEHDVIPERKKTKAQTKPMQPEKRNPVILYDLKNFNKIVIKRDQITYRANDGKTKISITDAADHFIGKYHLLASSAGSLRQGNRLWIYDTENGLYTPNGAGIVKYVLDNVCGNLCRSNIENEVINRICNQRPFNPERFDLE